MKTVLTIIMIGLFFGQIQAADDKRQKDRQENPVKICSFNIQFLGNFRNRRNKNLAKILKPLNCSMIVIQELVAPPVPIKMEPSLFVKEGVGILDSLQLVNQLEQSVSIQEQSLQQFSDQFLFNTQFSSTVWRSEDDIKKIAKERTHAETKRIKKKDLGKVFLRDPFSIESDVEAKQFFSAMAEIGFSRFVLSEEDTGASEKNHQNGAATEWWVTFFNDKIVTYADDLPSGFLAKDRSRNLYFERVPYAFPFRTVDGKSDFVVISVHLAPDKGAWIRRCVELGAIGKWIRENESTEKDFITIGDMNIEDIEDLTIALNAMDGRIDLESLRTLEEDIHTISQNLIANILKSKSIKSIPEEIQSILEKVVSNNAMILKGTGDKVFNEIEVMQMAFEALSRKITKSLTKILSLTDELRALREKEGANESDPAIVENIVKKEKSLSRTKNGVPGKLRSQLRKELFSHIIPATETSFASLNIDLKITNTNPKPKSVKPYDHAIFRPQYTPEIPIGADNTFEVIGLVKAATQVEFEEAITDNPNMVFETFNLYETCKKKKGIGVGQYNHDCFRTRYSDHSPVSLEMSASTQDDD